MGYRYIVFGAGQVGRAVVHDLLENCEAQRVVVIDPDDDALDALEDMALKDGRLEPYHGCSDEVISTYDVAISCAPYSINPELCRKCVEARVPFLDLGGNPGAFEKIRSYCEENDVDTPVVTDCGLAPGIVNMLASYLAGRHGCNDIKIICGGIPQVKPDNPFSHISAFSPKGLESEYSGPCPAIIDGKITSHISGSMAAPHGIAYEIFPTSNNSVYTAEYLKNLGVENYSYRTLRWAGHLSSMPKHDISDIPFMEHEDKVIINVTGKRRGKTIGFDVVVFPSNGFTAMASSTAVGITSVAYYIAKGGKVRRGFQVPEQLWSKYELMGSIFKALQIDER